MVRTAKEQADPRLHLLRMAKERAKKQGLQFCLSVDDIVIPKRCPVLGIPLFRSIGKSSDNSPSLDKIIPELGYTKDNILVISLRANRIKNNSCLSELRAILKFYEKLYNKSNY